MVKALENAEIAPIAWGEPCTSSEVRLHQLSPFIGRIKSRIANDLITDYSKPGDLVVDPFCGSGTIPLEAAITGRRVFAADLSEYSRILTKAKLFPPGSLDQALAECDRLLKKSQKLPRPDLRRVPTWVRSFFHPDTLVEALNFAEVCQSTGKEFYMACLLGILHHQRPGFLSYPSSHLVPYLRDQKFPRADYPDLYDYRELRPRIIAKVKRALSNIPQFIERERNFRKTSVQGVKFPAKIDCIITSPPYMNALDYVRDNRLRLWFITRGNRTGPADNATNSRAGFEQSMKTFLRKAHGGLRRGGYCVLVVGETVTRSSSYSLSEVVIRLAETHAPSFVLQSVTVDSIPDIRRARRLCKGVRRECVLVLEKKKSCR